MPRIRPRDIRRSGVLIAVAVALVACSPTDPAARSDRADSSPPPQGFTSRAVLPSCGSAEARGPGSTVADALPSDAMDCLNRARAARGAEFRSTAYTTEGDPIVTYYRVRPGTVDVEVFVDNSRDSFSAGVWKVFTCPVIVVSAKSLRACGAGS